MSGFLQWYNRYLPDVPPEWEDIIYITSWGMMSGKGYRYLPFFTVVFSNKKSEKLSGTGTGRWLPEGIQE